MADNWPGIFNIGTATVAANSTTVTLQGAGSIQTALRPGDRFGTHRGLGVRIAAVGTNTLTLAFPWTGPAQTAAPYEIALTPYASGYREELTKLLASLDSSPLGALAALTLAADRLPYANGPGSMALTPFTAQARALLDDASFTAMRETLGIGPTSSPTFASVTASSIGQVALVAERTGVATNSSIEFRTTGGSVFAGYGAAGTFAIDGDSNLSSSPWFAVTASGARVGGVDISNAAFTTSGVFDPARIPPGGLIAMTVRASSGTHTFHSLSNTALVYAIGAGGAGGSATAGGSSNASAGAGGGSGGVAIKQLSLAGINTLSCTIGAGGAGNGGTTTASGSGITTLTAAGGAVGANGIDTNVFGSASGGSGGSASGGDINIRGGPGENAMSQGATINSVINMIAGNGGSNMFGTGGAGFQIRTGSSAGGSGVAGDGYGGGGGGGARGGFAATNSGGAGASGAVIIMEFR